MQNLNCIVYLLHFAEIFEPKSYEEVINSYEGNKWIGAMEEEISSLAENITWTVVSTC